MATTSATEVALEPSALQLSKTDQLEVEQESQLDAFQPSTEPSAPQLSTTATMAVDALQALESGALQPPKNPSPLQQSIEGATGDGATTTPSSFNIIDGTPRPETINGTDGVDIIASRGGDDKVYGKGGDDAISGGSENDYVEGNDGNDIIYGDYVPSANADLIGGGKDELYGNKGNDKLYGQTPDDTIDGGPGNDLIEGGEGNDQIYGRNGDDLLYGDDQEQNPGVSGDDTVYGGNGNDQIFGGRGKDDLIGDAGNDGLVGGQGNDSLSGGSGKDRLIGTDTAFFGQLQQGFGFGEIDTLTGGINNDTFVLGLAQAQARDANGNDVVVNDVVLYNDGNPNANGTLDYALIKDFGFSGDGVTRGVDKIELAGSQSMYSLGASPISSTSGTGVFLNGSTAELIGILEGISLSNLSITNTNQFTFV